MFTVTWVPPEPVWNDATTLNVCRPFGVLPGIVKDTEPEADVTIQLWSAGVLVTQLMSEQLPGNTKTCIRVGSVLNPYGVTL